MFFVNGVPAGILTDKCGPTIPIAIGAVCELVAVFMVSLCKEYYQFFLAQGVLLGIGMAYITIAVTSTLPRYFVRNRGLAQGVSIAGSSLGGVIWPIVLDELLDTDGISFGWTLRICGFMMLPLMVIVIIGVKRPIVPKKQPVDSEAGLTRITTKEQKASDAKARKADLARLRHPSFILLCSGLALFYFGFFSPFFYLTTYAIHIGETQSFAFYLIAILNAASLFGRVIPGYIADRVGPFNIITVSMLGSAIVCFCWTAVTNTAGIVVFALAYGFISGVSLPRLSHTRFSLTCLIGHSELAVRMRGRRRIKGDCWPGNRDRADFHRLNGTFRNPHCRRTRRSRRLHRALDLLRRDHAGRWCVCACCALCEEQEVDGEGVRDGLLRLMTFTETQWLGRML